MANRVVHFEIQAEDPERAARFYGNVFGWDVKEWVIPGVDVADENRYWLVMTAEKGTKEPGIDGGIMFRQGKRPGVGQPVNAFVCTIGVESVDMAIEKAVSEGASVAQPKMPIQGVGWQAYLIDTEGNIFGVHQADTKADSGTAEGGPISPEKE